MWDLKIIDTDKSLYIAVADALERDIRLEILKVGDKLPAQRELAKKVGVNVTTITRAYKEAEKRGLVTSIVGSGTYVSSDSGFNPSLLKIEKDKKKHIELGLVMPLCVVEPDIGEIIKRVLHKNDLKGFMEYTSPQGLLRHRQTGSEWVKSFGVAADPENIIVTAGTQHALVCIFSSVFQPGDRIATDCLAYPGVKTAAKLCGVQLEAVEMDAEGMTPRGLAAVCNRHDIKGVYTVATLQNPTNAVMSETRLAAVAEVIHKYDLLLIEDDIYRCFSAEPPSTLSQLVPEQSLYLAGTSKAFYTGLRVCFVASPTKYVNRITQSVVDTMWMAPTLNAEIVCECIASGAAAEIIANKKAEIRRRADLMALKLSGYSYCYVPDSMFVWLELPDYWNGSDFEKTAYEYGVNVVSSGRFSIGGIIPPNHVRVSLSGTDSITELEAGLDILVKILNREIGLAGGVL